ncbi:hypothetical protein Stsp02_65610 [Streptomyces sp. NBRC 14336]|nr:hypothetical protein Stsp02_65610 [Streptomyces sp. NBRC 14336]
MSCGAQVITVIVPSSPAPPVTPGTTPHPAASDAAASSATALPTEARTGRVNARERVLLMPLLPVMDTHDSATRPTGESLTVKER